MPAFFPFCVLSAGEVPGKEIHGIGELARGDLRGAGNFQSQRKEKTAMNTGCKRTPAVSHLHFATAQLCKKIAWNQDPIHTLTLSFMMNPCNCPLRQILMLSAASLPRTRPPSSSSFSAAFEEAGAPDEHSGLEKNPISFRASFH